MSIAVMSKTWFWYCQLVSVKLIIQIFLRISQGCLNGQLVSVKVIIQIFLRISQGCLIISERVTSISSRSLAKVLLVHNTSWKKLSFKVPVSAHRFPSSDMPILDILTTKIYPLVSRPWHFHTRKRISSN